MTRFWTIALGLPAVIFVVIGLGWLIAPAFLAAKMGMPLLDPLGRSTQIGDLASFFLTLGGCMLLALHRGERVWLIPAMMLLGFAIMGRVVAWQIHGADFAAQMLTVEIVILLLLAIHYVTAHHNPKS